MPSTTQAFAVIYQAVFFGVLWLIQRILLPFRNVMETVADKD
jgi:hypothetical protein